MRQKVNELPESLRPRERLLRGSPEHLSDAELLAILLQSGTQKLNVIDLATHVYKEMGGWEGLSQARLPELLQLHGIGHGKACTLIAMAEIAYRMQPSFRESAQQVRTADMAEKVFRSLFRQWDQEVFGALFLNQRLEIIHQEIFFQGTVNMSISHPRDVFREAVRHNATSIILAHTHPGGSLEPSEEDIMLTRRMMEAGHVIGIPITDHLILIKDGRALSLKGENFM